MGDPSKTIAGFYIAELTDDAEKTWGLEALFVEPAYMGHGIGRKLMNDANHAVKGRQGRSLRIESDPNAEAFYVACGAKRVGQTASYSIEGRTLPLLRIDLEQGTRP